MSIWDCLIGSTPATIPRGTICGIVKEPVLSFVQYVKDNPNNFVCKQVFNRAHNAWKLIDRKNRVVYKFGIVSGMIVVYNSDVCSFLNLDEKMYLYSKLFKPWQDGVIETEEKDARQKYIDIYCKEGV